MTLHLNDSLIMTTTPSEFFAPLRRRPQYTTKRQGEFYSYEYYREHFRHEIAEDCIERCVYCDCHENEMGGRESMELDHFRPWSIAQFADLKNHPTNLHHACSRCNRLKAANWPSSNQGECHDGLVGFVDPFNDDRRNYFGVAPDGAIICLRHPATYMVRLLALDRPLLKLLRVRRMLRKEVAAYVQNLLPQIEAVLAGSGTLSKEALAAEWLKFRDYQRLLDLCDAPLRSKGLQMRLKVQEQ